MRIYSKDELPQHLPDGSANPDWIALRNKRFTGSDFYLFMSLLKKGELSDTAETKLYNKVLSLYYETSENVATESMERGTELEPIARELYKQETFNDVQEVGFVDFESLRAGCSPDGVIYNETTIIDDEFIKTNKKGELELVKTEPKICTMRNTNDIKKIIEIKCPEVKNYIKMVAQKKIPTQYQVQVQYEMFITGAKSCDFVVYHPDFKLYIQEILPDEKMQENIRAVLQKLNVMYDLIAQDVDKLIKG